VLCIGNPVGPMRQPLSEILTELFRETSPVTGLRLNRLLERTEGRGLYPVIIVLCLPFVVPVSVPGMSTLLGTMILLLLVHPASGRMRLPAFVGERSLPQKVQKQVAEGSVRLLRWLEVVVRPRYNAWLARRSVEVFNRILIAGLAFLLALPLPTPPFFFSNSLPSYAIIVLAASIMESDGFLIWAAYALVVVNLVFFAIIAGALAAGLTHGWNVFDQLWFQP
jgi:hypothetical protein